MGFIIYLFCHNFFTHLLQHWEAVTACIFILLYFGHVTWATLICINYAPPIRPRLTALYKCALIDWTFPNVR